MTEQQESLLRQGLAELLRRKKVSFHESDGSESVHSEKSLSPEEFPTAEELFPLFERYISEIELWNPKLGLVEANSDEIITKHILDCASSYPLLRSLFKKGDRLVDLGSGAGLPGIVLAILFPQIKVTLVEKMGRRVNFLSNVKLLLGLKNVEILNCSAESIEDKKFDFITSRAYSPLDRNQFQLISRLLQPEGIAVLYKGKKSKVRSELQWSNRDVLNANGQFREDAYYCWSYSVPFLPDTERHILIFKNSR